MRFVSAAIITVVLFAALPSAQAEVGVSPKIGTLGPGVDVTLGLSERSNLRLFGHMFTYNFVANRVEGDIDADIKGLNYGALLDFHPGGSSFRLSLGVMINANEVDLDADLTEAVNLAGIDFNLDDLTGEISFDELAPYIGIGFGNAVGADGNWHFSFDLGVFYQGEPTVSASAVSSIPALQPVVDFALAEEVADIQDDADKFTLYPFLAIGLSYKF
jgi:hypothetical protein